MTLLAPVTETTPKSLPGLSRVMLPTVARVVVPPTRRGAAGPIVPSKLRDPPVIAPPAVNERSPAIEPCSATSSASAIRTSVPLCKKIVSASNLTLAPVESCASRLVKLSSTAIKRVSVTSRPKTSTFTALNETDCSGVAAPISPRTVILPPTLARGGSACRVRRKLPSMAPFKVMLPVSASCRSPPFTIVPAVIVPTLIAPAVSPKTADPIKILGLSILSSSVVSITSPSSAIPAPTDIMRPGVIESIETVLPKTGLLMAIWSALIWTKVAEIWLLMSTWSALREREVPKSGLNPVSIA